MKGSISHLNYQALKYKDIKYVMYDDINHVVKIIVEKNYNIDDVKRFIDENIVLGIMYMVCVEENVEFETIV